MRRAALLLALCVAAPALLRAQEPAAAERGIASVDSLIGRGDVGRARAAIGAWWREHATDARLSAQLRARATYLRAQLASDADSATADYLTVALEYPTAPQAADALLRGAQGLLARGESARAADYLARLERDYPTGEHRRAGLLWLSRARRAAHLPGACDAVRAGKALVGDDAEVLTLYEAEERAACASSSQRFALQVAAFRAESGARETVSRLRSAGWRSRIVRLPGSALYRVRVGRFVTRADAVRMAARLRAQGFPPDVVDDAESELDPDAR